jgi:hypothetical protein
VLLAAAAAACGPKPIALPTGASTPVADVTPVIREALAHCAALHTITAEIGLSGKVGSARLRGRLQAGFADPAAVRLEAVAPFGAPFFILAGADGRATLLLPRDARVLADSDPAQILDALAGIAVAPDDLRSWLAGCPAVRFEPREARAFGQDWMAIDGADGRTIWLRRAGAWRLVAARNGSLSIEFTGTSAQPALVRIRRDPASDLPSVDARLALSQVETNVTLPEGAFKVDVPAGTTPMTLDELRQSGPLRSR